METDTLGSASRSEETMRHYKNILVPYDGTISTEYTLRMSCRIARWNQSHVLVVVPFFAKDVGDDEQNDITLGVKMISRQEKVPMDVLFQDGRPSDTIIDVSHKKENDLIVMGKAEMSALEKFVIGSITGRVIGYSKCDVIIVPEDRLLRWNKILLCVDGSKYSKTAVDNAIAYATHFNGTINAVSIVDVTEEFYALSPETANEMVYDAINLLDGIADKAKEIGVDVNTFVKEGETHEKVLEVAQEVEADVIIMGSHERVGLGSLMLGSVARKVSMNADCPVFIIKP